METILPTWLPPVGQSSFPSSGFRRLAEVRRPIFSPHVASAFRRKFASLPFSLIWLPPFGGSSPAYLFPSCASAFRRKFAGLSSSLLWLPPLGGSSLTRSLFPSSGFRRLAEVRRRAFCPIA